MIAVGFHDSQGDGRSATGLFEQYILPLDAEGIPALYKGVGLEPFDIQRLMAVSGVPHVSIYRDANFANDVPDYRKSAIESAREHWAKHIALLPTNFDPSLSWLETINEVAKEFTYSPEETPDIPVIDGRYKYNREDGTVVIDNLGWLGRFAGETARLAVAGGYKWLAFGFSAGEPEVNRWLQTVQMTNFLNYAAAYPGQIGIALHEYSFSTDCLLNPDENGINHLIGRVGHFIEALRAANVGVPDIHLTEWGWTKDRVPEYPVAREQIRAALEYYGNFPKIKSLAIWHIGGGKQWGDIANQTNKYFEPMAADMISSYFPFIGNGGGTEPPPPPPEEKPQFIFPPFTRTEILHPQNLTPEQREVINGWLKDGIPNELIRAENPGGLRPVGRAGWTHQDAIEAVYQAAVLQGKTDSLVIVADGEQIGTGLDAAWVEENFPELFPYFRFVATAEPAPPPGLNYLYWPVANSKWITQLWGANPAVYGQYGLPGHEGIDIGANYGVGVHAVMAGVVVHASPFRMSSTTGLSAYGYYVILNHGNGHHTLYGHLQPNFLVGIGQTVGAGQIIGRIGNGAETPAENSTGPHLHFSHLWQTAPNNGYPVTRYGRYIDPSPMLQTSLSYPPQGGSVPNRYIGPPIKGGFHWGLDQPASDWDWNRVKPVFDETGLHVKFHTNGQNHEWFDAYKGPHFNPIRVLINPAFRGGPQETFNEIQAGIAAFYDRGGRDFILFNEPNIEGLGVRFNNGAEFGVYFKAVCELAKARFPEIRIWFPPVSPSGDGRINGWDFVRDAKAAGGFSHIYGMGQHVYTGITTDAGAAVSQMIAEVRKWRDLYAINRPLLIGEFSVNRPAGATYKADVYKRFYLGLSSIEGIQGAYSFTSSWYGGQSGQWGRDWDINQESWFEGGIKVANGGIKR